MKIARCRVCECTQDDCFQCVEATGDACEWVNADLCSACVALEAAAVLHRVKGPLWLRDLALLVGVDMPVLRRVLMRYGLFDYFACIKDEAFAVEIWDLTARGREVLIDGACRSEAA